MTTIFLDYVYWHWAAAPGGIMRIMQNYMTANWHRFLIVQHFRTLFAPWHRQNPSDFSKKSPTFTDRILDFMVDVYIRIIAALVRMAIIIAGLLMEVLIMAGFLILLAVWILWPAIAIYSIVRGIIIL